MAADVKAQKCVGHEEAIFRVRFEAAGHKHVEHLPDVSEVICHSAAVNHNIVYVTLGASHKSSFSQLL